MGITPFLRHTEPYEGESLSSVIRRALVNNHCPAFKWAERLLPSCPARKRAGQPNLFYHAPELSDLSELLLLPRERLYDATIHKFAGVLQSQDRLLHSDDLLFLDQSDLRRFALRGATKYCPLCLSEGLYHRTYWDLLPATMCLRHSILLRDRCPVCNGRIDHGQLISGKHKCGHKLCADEGCPPPGKKVSFDSQVLIASLLQSEHPNPPDFFTGPAFRLPSPDFFLILDILERIILAAGNRLRLFKVEDLEWDGLPSRIFWRQMLANRDRHILLLAAFCVLTDWPHNFFAFLDEYRTRGKEAVYGELSRQCLPLKGLVDPSSRFSFMSEAFSRYVCRWDRAVLRASSRLVRDHQDRGYVGLRGTAALLKIPYGAAKILVREGRLQSVRKIEGSRTIYLVSRKAILMLQKEWRNKLTLAQVEENLAVSTRVVRELIGAGLLCADRVTTKLWLVNRSDLDGFRAAYLASNAAAERQSDFLTTGQAAQALKYASLQEVRMLELVRDGVLTPFVAPGERGLPGLRFLSEQCTLKGVSGDTLWLPRPSRRNLISPNGAARLLGIKEPSLAELISAGLLKAVRERGGTGRTVTRIPYGDLIRFRSSYVRTGEAAALLGAGPKTLSGWARSRMLQRLSMSRSGGANRYLYLRTDLEKMTPENRLPLRDAASYLSVSEMFFGLLISCRMLVPIKKTSMKYVLRADLDLLQARMKETIRWGDAAKALSLSVERLEAVVTYLRDLGGEPPESHPRRAPNRLEIDLLQRGTLKLSHVARMLHVDRKTVARWSAKLKDLGEGPSNGAADNRAYALIDLWLLNDWSQRRQFGFQRSGSGTAHKDEA